MNSLLEFNCPSMKTFSTQGTEENIGEKSSIKYTTSCPSMSPCIQRAPPSSEPSFLPGNLAGMQHGVLSVSVNFLALEPGIEKGKSQKPGGKKPKTKKPSPNLFIKSND